MRYDPRSGFDLKGVTLMESGHYNCVFSWANNTEIYNLRILVMRKSVAIELSNVNAASVIGDHTECDQGQGQSPLLRRALRGLTRWSIPDRFICSQQVEIPGKIKYSIPTHNINANPLLLPPSAQVLGHLPVRNWRIDSLFCHCFVFGAVKTIPSHVSPLSDRHAWRSRVRVGPVRHPHTSIVILHFCLSFTTPSWTSPSRAEAFPGMTLALGQCWQSQKPREPSCVARGGNDDGILCILKACDHFWVVYAL